MLRPIKIRQYVQFMERRGFSPRETLRGSDIDVTRLPDPGYLLEMRQCETVVSNMIRLTGNQGVAFEIGAEANAEEFGVVGQAMLSSPTLGDAIGYWIRYSNLVGMMIHHTLIEGSGKEWTVAFSAIQPMGFIYNFCVEEILVAGTKLGAGLTHHPISLKEVHLSYPAPLHAGLYKKYLNSPIHFNSTRSSITARSPALSHRLPGYDEELNEIYLRHCREVLRQIAGDDPILTRLRGIFVASRHALPDFEAAAMRLGTSTRTLRRKLAAEGTSYQQLLSRFRMERVMDLLRDEHLSAKEIAGLVGFDEANSLRRAFKTWTGKTLQEYREEIVTASRRKKKGSAARASK